MNKSIHPYEKIQHDIRTPLIIIDTALKIGEEISREVLSRFYFELDVETKEKMESFNLLIINSLKQVRKIEAILNDITSVS